MEKQGSKLAQWTTAKYKEFSSFLKIINIRYLILFPEVIHVILLILIAIFSVQMNFKAI